MNLKIFSVLSVLIFIVSGVLAQNPDGKPIPILPNNSITNNTSDTMWVLNSTKQFRKVTIALNNQKLYKKLIVKNNQLIDSLKSLDRQLTLYNDSLKSERNLYIEQVDECEKDLSLLGEMNQKQSKYTRLAIIIGGSTTVTAFIVGFILGIK